MLMKGLKLISKWKLKRTVSAFQKAIKKEKKTFFDEISYSKLTLLKVTIHTEVSDKKIDIFRTKAYNKIDIIM